MTRRGSLAYYLAAWICGCVFMSVCLWIWVFIEGGRQNEHLAPIAFSLLLSCFYGLIIGAAASLLFAFLLRRLMAALRWRAVLQWTIAGAILNTIVVVALGNCDRWANAHSVAALSRILTAGPAVVMDTGWWIAIPAGAATAYVLYRIDRAFAPQSSPSDQAATMAGGHS
jgi:hypothetical protein